MFLSVESLVKSYPQSQASKPMLDDVSFTLEKGKLGVVLGSKESGKTTLMEIIGGIDSADSGNVIVNGSKVTMLNSKQLTLYRRNEIGFVFKHCGLFSALTVKENIKVTSEISKSPLDINEILSDFEMQDTAKLLPCKLNHFERQKLNIAMAAVKKPSLLLCYEPTRMLDSELSKKILTHLVSMNTKHGITILLFTRNMSIGGIADKTICLSRGKVAEKRSSSLTKKITVSEIEW